MFIIFINIIIKYDSDYHLFTASYILVLLYINCYAYNYGK